MINDYEVFQGEMLATSKVYGGKIVIVKEYYRIMMNLK